MKKVLTAVLAGSMVATMAVPAFAAVTITDSGSKDINFTQVYLKDATSVLPSSGSKPTYSVSSQQLESVPDKTYYYAIPTIQGIRPSDLANKDYFNFKVKKDEGSKYFKSISVQTKKIGGVRTDVVEVKLNDDMSDSDLKLEFTATFTAKSKAATDGIVTDGSVGKKLEMSTQRIWMGNNTQNADYDAKAGEHGIVIKPTANDDNEITWENENDTIARLSFYGDDDTNKFWPKLSTKWDNSDYEEYFADQDAYIFDFQGHPTISSTSRAVLELYNPYVNDDGEVYNDEVVIYEVVDGQLVDVTAKFTHEENDEGDDVFTIKTRTLGTYIFAEKEAGVADDLPDEAPTTDAPVDGDKAIPNTGR